MIVFSWTRWTFLTIHFQLKRGILINESTTQDNIARTHWAMQTFQREINPCNFTGFVPSTTEEHITLPCLLPFYWSNKQIDKGFLIICVKGIGRSCARSPQCCFIMWHSDCCDYCFVEINNCSEMLFSIYNTYSATLVL